MAAPKNRLSICIPTFRRAALLEKLLADLARQTRRPETLIVVDGDPASGTTPPVALQSGFATTYVPASRANLPFQRYLGWLAARGSDVLLFLDDDLRLPDPTAVEIVAAPFESESDVVGVTAPIENLGAVERCSPWARRLGSSRAVRAGDLTPSGNRTQPPDNGRDYEPVGWLRGGVMAFRRDALDESCFREDLFALAECGWGLGEDTLLARKALARGKLLLARWARFVHPCADATRSFSTEPESIGYARAFSRRLLNDCYRGDAPPRLSDRFALLASYLGNGALATARAAREGGDQRRYAWGYLCGALRGAIESPSAERLTPRIDWAGEARRSMAAARPAES